MKTIQKKERLRRLSFRIFLFAVLVWPLGCQIYGMFWGWSSLSNLSFLIDYWFYFCAILSVVVYLCLSASQLEDVDETISGYRGTGYYQRNGLKYFLVLFVVSQILVFGMMEYLVFRIDPSNYAWFVLPKMFVCNLLLPLLICILVACVTAQWHNQQVSAILLIVFLVLSSPLSEILLTDSGSAGVLFYRLGYMVRHTFAIFYEQTYWYFNTQAGLQTEWTRFAVQFFWILLCLGAMCLMKKRKLCLSGCLLLACAAACLVYAQLPASTFRHYNNNADYNLFYKEQLEASEEIGLREEEDPGYTIRDYDLTLDFGRQLRVEGRMVIEAEQPEDVFAFTLYRGYRIKELEGAQLLTWSVQDDLVTIQTKQPVKRLELTLRYQGYNNLFYSNMDGAMLPGWFPWYPMAGEKQIYLGYGNQGAEYNSFNRIQPAHIRLTVDAPYALVCNLTQVAEQQYEGESDSITVIGGYVTQTEDPLIANILPLDLSVTDEQMVGLFKESFQQVCDAMEAYGLDVSLLSGRKMILTSYDLVSNGTGGDVAIFSDYILATTGSMQFFSNYAKALMIPFRQNALPVYIRNIGVAETPEETLEWWSLALDKPAEEFSDVEKQFAGLLNGAKEAGEGEQLVREVVAFLISEHTEADEDIFWKELSERYGTA